MIDYRGVVWIFVDDVDVEEENLEYFKVDEGFYE